MSFNFITEPMVDFIVSTFTEFDNYLAESLDVIVETNVFTGNWNTIATKISSIIEPSAITICGICFLIQFLRLTINSDILKWELMLKVSATFCVARASIDISSQVLEEVYVTVSKWISSVTSETIDVGNKLGESAQTALASCSGFEILGIFLTSFLFLVFIKLISICIKVMAYARAFELTCVNAVAPLPFAFLCLDDGGSSRVFKNFAFVYISICLRGLFMVISISVFSTLANSISFSSWSTGLYDLLVFSLVLLMGLVKSDQWAKQLFNG